MDDKKNATFHCFKETGKWYASDRGYLTAAVFSTFDHRERRARILDANFGAYPGLSSDGSEFIFVVIGDDELDYGYPLMLFP